MLFKKRPFLSFIKEYNNNYFILVKLSILYYYKIFLKITELLTFNK
ncbi:hypothetical protein CORC01_04022 [Colletotrichum orchidophilum]|uniref:Uncharacterized protein n=1 Tax=Colletotrichum orchidophilum TaxID=1209926 RepID=A0A1G4BH51_9PEZI|nr:uncharacterized protein CORC01_04022 [Colletotrichum orchidophilum]OHF00705.1 hypothetical protein CORC01_04022 [Colletotrichum orchidophilum]